MSLIINIENLGFDSGAHVLIKQALIDIPVGSSFRVTGQSLNWEIHLSTWCRSQGHGLEIYSKNGKTEALITKGHADRWQGAESTGRSSAEDVGAVADQAKASWGLAARGATVELGSPEFDFRLNEKKDIWADDVAELYSQAVEAQWNPDVAIDWKVQFELPEVVEKAVVQVMTYMVENEAAALIVPARFLGQLHPHFREVQALLAIQIADEARHIEVFTRRVLLKSHQPSLSTAGGQASLKTLLDQTDFSVAGFLLSVLGEGTFVSLLNFLQAYAPDPVTKQICRLAARDESRHVAFGMAHLTWRIQQEPDFRFQLVNAVQTRNDILATTAGLNEDVFDSLIILAAGDLSPDSIRQGYGKVQKLIVEMAEGRRVRLIRLGFDAATAEALSNMHTRNFM